MRAEGGKLIRDRVERDALGQPAFPDFGHLRVSGGVEHDKTVLVKQSELDALRGEVRVEVFKRAELRITRVESLLRWAVDELHECSHESEDYTDCPEKICRVVCEAFGITEVT